MSLTQCILNSILNLNLGTSFGLDIKNVTFGDEVFHALET
jgi:hypothetical protein